MQEFFANGVSELDDGAKKEKGQPKQREVKPRKCPRCHNLHNPRPTCPRCGHEYPVRSVEHLAGELVELAGTAATPAEKRQFFGELRTIAYTRGYSEGWCAHAYRERFGTWPNAFRDAPRHPVTDDTYRWVQRRLLAHAKAKRKLKKEAVG